MQIKFKRVLELCFISDGTLIFTYAYIVSCTMVVLYSYANYTNKICFTHLIKLVAILCNILKPSRLISN